MRTDDSLLTLTISAINVIGASLSEPHTNGTALQDACVYVCLRTYVRPYTENLNWTNENGGTRAFQICIRAEVLCDEGLLNV